MICSTNEATAQTVVEATTLLGERFAMHEQNTKQFGVIQGRRDATRCSDGGFSPVTSTRTQVTPPTRNRLMRRFFELGHSIRVIAKTEGLSEKAIEQMAREKYWDNRNDGDTGPFPGAGAVRHSGFGGGLFGYTRKAA
jgi:hypothetical protein